VIRRLVDDSSINNTRLLVFFGCLAIAVALNGIFDGIGRTISTAVFADSIILCTDNRGHHQRVPSHYYVTQKLVWATVGYILGPVVGLVSFWCLGDEWTISTCAMVMCGAQVVLIPAFLILCRFQDVREDDDVERQATNGTNGNERPIRNAVMDDDDESTLCNDDLTFITIEERLEPLLGCTRPSDDDDDDDAIEDHRGCPDVTSMI